MSPEGPWWIRANTTPLKPHNKGYLGMSVKGHRTKPGDTETGRTLLGGTQGCWGQTGDLPLSPCMWSPGTARHGHPAVPPGSVPRSLASLGCAGIPEQFPREKQTGAVNGLGRGLPAGTPTPGCRLGAGAGIPSASRSQGTRCVTCGCPAHPCPRDPTEGQGRGHTPEAECITWGAQSTPKSSAVHPRGESLPGAGPAGPHGTKPPVCTQPVRGHRGTLSPHRATVVPVPRPRWGHPPAADSEPEYRPCR